jgi:hypothetical protein
MFKSVCMLYLKHPGGDEPEMSKPAAENKCRLGLDRALDPDLGSTPGGQRQRRSPSCRRISTASDVSGRIWQYAVTANTAQVQKWKSKFKYICQQTLLLDPDIEESTHEE